ncbi:MAG: MmgE/PrpD family protein, partial [Desulfobacterales bacterium]|nr:MmgE/PrpD family protein [Desulfobacterales bacterium]
APRLCGVVCEKKIVSIQKETTMQSPTRTLATFLSELTYDRLPPAVVARAKVVLLDTLGAAVGGSRTPEGRIAIRLAQKLSGKQEATLLATGVKVDCLYAALVNGLMAHVLELDDGNRYAMGHPGVSVVPTVLALGEQEHITGRDAIVATVAGYEAMSRVAAAGNPSHYHRGFHTTGTCGTFASAAAAGKILNLNPSETAMAFGIAGSQSAGLFAFMANGAMTKVLHPGRAAQSGILSVYLVREGFTGPETVLEDPRGFYAAYADGYVPERIVDRLGEIYEIMHTYTKDHAACRHTHAAIDAALGIADTHPVAVSDIAAITVHTYQVAAKLTGGKQITSPLSGKMSLPYSVAVALTDGQAGLQQYSSEKLNDPAVRGLMGKIEVRVDARLDSLVPAHRGARVEMVLTSGQRHTAEVIDALGEPENPGSLADQLKKFKALAGVVFDEDRLEQIIATVQNLEAVADINSLAALLRQGP